MGLKSMNNECEVEQFDTVKTARLRVSIAGLKKLLATQEELLVVLVEHPNIEGYLTN
jgi:hypothetical protein